MKSLFLFTVLALNLAGAQAGYSLTVYSAVNYGGKHYECFSTLPRTTLCCDWSQTVINDNLNSFDFTTASNCGITLFKDWKCSGDVLGTSYGVWAKPSVSSAGQQGSSAQIDCY